MADNVLSVEDLEFLKENEEQIRQFAKCEFAGHVPMDKRAMYEQIRVKAGFRTMMNWTCGSCLEKMGKRLEQWL